jgi:bifunctional DNase/RNase
VTTEPQHEELPEEGRPAEGAVEPEVAHDAPGGPGAEAGEHSESPGGLDDEPAAIEAEGAGAFEEEPGGFAEEAGELDEEPAVELDEEARGLHEDEVEVDEDEVYGEPGDGSAFEPSPMRQVVFINVEVFLPSTNPVMVLRELEDPFRELRITIGSPEGVAIAYGWRGIDTPKPLTHELFTEVFEVFGLSLEVVKITAVRGTAYSGEIVVNGPQGSRVIQCRVSDAIALAVRQPLPVPIMVSPEVLDEVGSTEY